MNRSTSTSDMLFLYSYKADSCFNKLPRLLLPGTCE
jgi:hypothetical protein